MSDCTDTMLRPFVAEDLAALKQLVHGTIDACYTGIYPPRAVDFFKGFHTDAAIGQRAVEGYTIVLVRNGAICGTGTLLKGHITAVYVQPCLQGRGMGKTIMRHLEERARGDGLGEVTLHASLPSRKFYESIGYELSAEDSNDVGDGEQLRYYRARKRLTM